MTNTSWTPDPVLGLFLELVERSADERGALLDDRCSGNAELRSNVLSLLALHDRNPEFLHEPPEALLAEASMPWASLSPGTRIGDFQVQSVLGKGGMGVVYLAQQSSLRRMVALKVIRPELATPTMLQRFRKEAEVVARLADPGIAQIFDCQLHHVDGVEMSFFAMEYVANARPITEYVRQKGFSTLRKLELFAKVCEAVHHAHQKLIIHRDLKPSNILVGEDGTAKVIDFGVASAVDVDEGPRAAHTEFLTGTPQYMSPEQCNGEHLDTRSDVYALGLILYEVLTGRRPYDLSGASPASAARLIAEQVPTPPSNIDPGLRGDLDAIAITALERKPDCRYQSAKELADDVRRYLAKRPIIAKPDSRWYRFTMFRRRNRAAFWAGVAAVLVLVAGVIGTSYGMVLADAARADAQAFGDYFDKHLQSLTSDGSAVLDMSTAAIMTRMGVGLDQGDLKDRPAAKARVLRTISGILDANGERTNAEKRARQVLEIEKGLHRGDHQNLLESLQCLAAVLVGGTSQDKEEAISLLLEALEMGERLHRAKSRIVAAILGQLANTYFRADRKDEAVERQALALRTYKAVFREKDHPVVALNHRFLGYLIEKRGHPGDNEEAVGHYILSLEMRRRLVAANHPDVVAVLARYGLDRAKLQPDDDPEIAAALNSLGWVYHSMGREDDAETAFTQVLNIHARLNGPGKPGVADPLTRFADSLCKNSNPTRAEKLYVAALGIQEREYGIDHKDRARTMADLARCHLALGRLRAAVEGAEEAVAMTVRMHLAVDDDTRRHCANVLAEIKEREQRRKRRSWLRVGRPHALVSSDT